MHMCVYTVQKLASLFNSTKIDISLYVTLKY